MQKETYTLKIADIIFVITSYPDEYTKSTFEKYMIPNGDYPDAVTVNCSLTEEAIPEPEGKLLTERDTANWYMHENGSYTITFSDPEEDVLCARLCYNDNTSHAELLLLDANKLYGTDTEFFLSNVLQYMYRLALVFKDGFTIHASSIINDGYGIAFSAQSGTGKSTHTALWQKVYPDTVLLNDDGPSVRKKDGVWYIYGTPWAGTTGININTCAPLKALVFLERSEVNTIRTLSALEGIRRIFEAIIHPVSDELMSIVLSSVSSFITESTMCVLGCNMTDDAPKTVKQYLYKQGE